MAHGSTPAPGRRIPTAALLLGLAGLLPFAWAALTVLPTELRDWTRETLGGRFVGRGLMLRYGLVILCFMAGTSWGFASRAGDGRGARAAAILALSTLPALWILFVGRFSVLPLIVGLVALLPLDAAVQRMGMAPPWWMRLRLLLTGLAVLLLLPGLA